MSDFLTTEEVGKRLRITASQVCHLAAQGKLPHVRRGRRIYIPARVFEEYLERMEAEARANCEAMR